MTLENIKCDVAIVGGGLAGGLIALALAGGVVMATIEVFSPATAAESPVEVAP